MEKKKEYGAVKFSARTIRSAISKCSIVCGNDEYDRRILSATIGNEKWRFDDLEEFFSFYINDKIVSASVEIAWRDPGLVFEYFMYARSTSVSVSNSSRSNIESVFSIFEDAPLEDRIAIGQVERSDRPRVFIGHGRNSQWQTLKSHLQDKHGLDIVSYESGARAGHTIRDVLDSMSEDASFALLILTGEDKTDNGVRARQNVIHECGLFQGRLGFDRAILVVEQGVELASNFDGIQQLRFKKGRISEIFGDVVATIRREFGPF